MAVRENRFVRVEDWNGNIYHLNGSSGSGNGISGIIIDALDAGVESSKLPYTEGSHTSDPYANGGNALVLSSGDVKKTLIVADISKLPFGNVTINARIKSTLSESATEILEVNTYYVDTSSASPVIKNLDCEKFLATNFDTDEYTNIAFTTNFNGVDTGETKLRIEIVAIPRTGATFYFDQMAVGMELGYGTDGKARVAVDDDTVVIVQKNKVDVKGSIIVVH